MKAFQKAFAASLLCGAMSFALPSQAAQTANQPANSGAVTESTGSTSNAANGTAEQQNTNTKSGPARRTVRLRRTAAARSLGTPAENEQTADLNRQSLQAVEAGTTPNFAASSPADNQQTQGSGAGTKTAVRTRARRTRVSKKPAG